ncbi:MAG: SpoIIE family protein phosphatase, partial [Anaerolineaceae bacterium]|nr:SpoIIE family protein phosphatase [Anaerolineaceae bacterium]
MILVELEKNLPCDTSAIWLLDEPYDPAAQNGQPLRLAAGRGSNPQKLINARNENAPTREWIDQALVAKEPVIRLPSDPLGPLGIANDYPNDYSSIAAPLKSGDQILGIITLAHKTSGRYGSEAKMMTDTFASYAAVAIQNARLFASAQAEAWTSTVLLQVSEASQSYTNLDDLLATMARVTPLMVGVKKSAIFLWDSTQEGFELKSSYGIPDEAQQILYTDENAPAFRTLRELKTPLYIQNSTIELNLPELDPSVDHSTIILMPLMARGEILGALLVFHQIDNKMENSSIFDDQNLSILQGIAHQTSVAIENIKLIEARQEEAYVTAVLLQVAQAVVSQNELNDILDTVVHLLPILVGVDTCLLYLYDPALGIYHPTKAYTGSHAKETEILKRSFAEGEYPLLDKIKASDRPVICPLDDFDLPVEDWQAIICPTGDAQPTPRQLASGSFLIGFPLSVKGELYGIMLNKESHVPAPFHDRRMEIMTGIAQQISLAIQNERLKQEMVGRERLEREFQLARQIQKTFLPNELPQISGWEMDIRWQTAREVGGDFYDVFKLGNDLYGLAIADVSDKGMPAALYMTVTRTLIRSSARNEKSPARVLSKVNTLLMLDQQNSMFVTAIYATLNTSTGELVISNAGHNQPILYRAADHCLEILPRGQLALGVLDRIKYEDHVVKLNPNDNLVLYTDGVTESFSKTGEPFGEERLGELILNTSHDNICRLLEEIEKVNTDFRGGEPPSDDLTLLAIRRLENEKAAQC